MVILNRTNHLTGASYSQRLPALPLSFRSFVLHYQNCIIWESNPWLVLGRYRCYHYTNDALTLSGIYPDLKRDK